MKVLVYVNRMTIGGSQIQAMDLAAAIQERGHEVVFSVPDAGPLVELAMERELTVVPLSMGARVGGRDHNRAASGGAGLRAGWFAASGRQPSVRAAWALRRLVRRDGFDLIHTYEVPPALEAFFGVHVAEGLPLVSSVLAIGVPRRFLRTVPLVVVTRAVQREVLGTREGEVFVLEPPVDLAQDRPSVDGSELGRSWGLDEGIPNVVIVSRLIQLRVQDKLEGIERTMDAVELLGRERPVRLVIVGAGPARQRLAERAQAINASLGQRAVMMPGPLVDPRPAYALADVVVGQAGSILRGMAFGKPAIVIGSAGFSEIVRPDTVAQFLDFGWWGIGDGQVSHQRLYRQLKTLLDDNELRENLGRFGRQFVRDRYSLESAAASLERIYERALARPPARRKLAPEIARVASWILAVRVKQRLLRGLQLLHGP